MYKISRLHISLSLKTFLKSLFFSKSNDEFTKVIRNYLGYKFIFPTSMCRTGFLLILEYLKKKNPKKNEILISSYNLKEMIDIPRILGFKIILIDIYKNGLINTKDLQKKISKSTAAILLTNMFNNSKDSEVIKKISNKKDILLIEDNAIYFGNYYNNKKIVFAGSFGDISIGSFGIMKNICSLYGGYLGTNNKFIAKYINERIYKFQNFPNLVFLKKIFIYILFKILTTKLVYNFFFFYILKIGHKYNINCILKLAYPAEHFKKKTQIPKFYYSKISKFSKKILNEIFKKKIFETDSKIRKYNIKLYCELLKNIPQVKTLQIQDYDFQNFLEFPVLVSNKNELSNHLFNNGIETKKYYYKNCEELISNINKFKNHHASLFEKNLLCLPCHPEITHVQIYKVCNVIKKFYKV
jgi:dTDP-4-amino-4,6-dideoxygalactose transaminase